jgi:acyl-CoA synthetase (AMP-forming)/AMP-acid ligase II
VRGHAPERLVDGKEHHLIYRSPIPDVPVPSTPLTAFVLERAAEYGDRVALVDGPSGRTLSYTDLARLVRRCAAGLAARGLLPNEVVGIYSPNVPEYAVAFHGVASAGGASTTANALYTADELAFQLRDARARFLITVPELLERAAPAAREAGVEEVFVFGEAAGATPFAALLEEDGDPPTLEIDTAEHVVSLPYSSGTTGFPKGVMLTHRNLVANVLQTAAVRPLGPADVVVGVLPFFHSYGQTVVMNMTLRYGATVVTMPRFDLEQYLTLSQEHGATLAYVAPPLVLALAKHPLVADYDLSTLRSMLSGAAPLDAELARACSERLGCEVVQGYGLTEVSPVSHITPIGAPLRPGSIGPLAPGTEARIVDVATGEDVEQGESGELLLRGPQVMKGYLNDERATAASFVDGWLRTGDVGSTDADGWFFIVDRIKELIKVKGFQVAPAELEALLLTHPAVADACVIGVPDEEAGESPKGFVVLQGDATPEELMTYVAERVTPHKRIRRLEVIDAVPKSPSGKILRRVLAERERAASESEVET